MNEQALVLAEVCDHLENGDSVRALRTLTTKYSMAPPAVAGRRYTKQQLVAQFFTDGFIDRYSGTKLVFPPVLTLLSYELGDKFPYHPNWKMSETHPAYWDLYPTLDHVVPLARGGVDEPSNWVTTSMARNAAKGASTLEQIGWTLYPPGDPCQWDGLTSWFTRYVATHPERRSSPRVAPWARALMVFQSD